MLKPQRKDGKWGYCDEHGRWVIQPRFDLASRFSQGLAAVAVVRSRKRDVDPLPQPATAPRGEPWPPLRNEKFVANVVYNAAANLTTAALGGPEALTARCREPGPDERADRHRPGVDCPFTPISC